MSKLKIKIRIKLISNIPEAKKDIDSSEDCSKGNNFDNLPSQTKFVVDSLPNLKTLIINDQIRELQTIIRDK